MQKVILLTGPAGAGKTSIAKRIAQNPDWVCISEDSFWEEIKRGRPFGEMRTEAEQNAVQTSVLMEIMELAESGKNVVLEFILYEDPPRPLIVYFYGLSSRKVHTTVKLLKPTVEAILERQKVRGRQDDMNIEQAKANALHQIKCLESAYIHQEWVVDDSQKTLEEVYEGYFSAIVEDELDLL